MARIRSKPEFVPSGGIWANSDFLPAPILKELRKAAALASMSETQTEEFLARCSEVAYECLEIGEHQPVARTQRELRLIESRARALLVAMGAASAESIRTFNAHFDYLAFGSAPPVALCDASVVAREKEGRFLSASWDCLVDLEATAEYAADRCKPERTGKPKQQQARGLVYMVALAVKGRTGKRPPYSKETWFPKFMSILGAHLALPCGRALVESVIRERFPLD